MTSEEEKKKREQSLVGFIEANEKLLTALGVLIALMLFAKEENKLLGSLISFFFLSAAMLVYVELFLRFEKGSWRLEFFQNFLFLALAALTFRWLVELQRTAGVNGVYWFFLLVFLGGGSAILRLLKAVELANRIKWRGVAVVTQFVLFAALFAGAHFAANAIAPPTSILLKEAGRESSGAPAPGGAVTESLRASQPQRIRPDSVELPRPKNAGLASRDSVAGH